MPLMPRSKQALVSGFMALGGISAWFLVRKGSSGKKMTLMTMMIIILIRYSKGVGNLDNWKYEI